MRALYTWSEPNPAGAAEVHDELGRGLWGLAGAGGALLLSYVLIVVRSRGRRGEHRGGRRDAGALGPVEDERRPLFWLAWVVGTLVTASMYLVLLVAAAERPTTADFIVFTLFPIPAMLGSACSTDAAANAAVVLTAAASMTLLLTVDGHRDGRVCVDAVVRHGLAVVHHVVIDAVWWAPSNTGTPSASGHGWPRPSAPRSTRPSADETKLVRRRGPFAVSWRPSPSIARATRHSGSGPRRPSRARAKRR